MQRIIKRASFGVHPTGEESRKARPARLRRLKFRVSDAGAALRTADFFRALETSLPRVTITSKNGIHHAWGGPTQAVHCTSLVHRTMKLVSLLVAIIAVAWLFPGVQIAATFDPKRLRLVAKAETSLLVRGNAPLNKQGEFDPSMILDAVQTHLAPDRNLGNYTLVVVSLLSGSQSDERAVLQKELDFESSDDALNPSTRILHRPIVGTWLAPPPLSIIPDWIHRVVWNVWRPDDGAWDLVQELHHILMNESHSVIYIHCMRGMDRTGLVTGAYLLRFGNASSEQVDQLNRDVAKRSLNRPAQVALQWIAWKS